MESPKEVEGKSRDIVEMEIKKEGEFPEAENATDTLKKDWKESVQLGKISLLIKTETLWFSSA